MHIHAGTRVQNADCRRGRERTDDIKGVLPQPSRHIDHGTRFGKFFHSLVHQRNATIDRGLILQDRPLSIKMSNSPPSSSVRCLVTLGEVVLSLGDLGIETFIEFTFDELILGTVDSFYGCWIGYLDLVGGNSDKRAISFVKWELVILSASVSHSAEVPQRGNRGEERAWNVLERMKEAIVNCQAKDVRDETSSQYLQTIDKAALGQKLGYQHDGGLEGGLEGAQEDEDGPKATKST